MTFIYKEKKKKTSCTLPWIPIEEVVGTPKSLQDKTKDEKKVQNSTNIQRTQNKVH